MSGQVLGPPSSHARQLVDSLRRGGAWWGIGQELLMKQLPITVDAFVPRLGDLLDLAFYASMTTEEAHRATFSIAWRSRITGFIGSVSQSRSM